MSFMILKFGYKTRPQVFDDRVYISWSIDELNSIFSV